MNEPEIGRVMGIDYSAVGVIRKRLSEMQEKDDPIFFPSQVKIMTSGDVNLSPHPQGAPHPTAS